RVDGVGRTIADIAIEVGVAAAEAEGVLAQEAAEGGIVVARAVVRETRFAVELPAGVGKEAGNGGVRLRDDPAEAVEGAPIADDAGAVDEVANRASGVGGGPVDLGRLVGEDLVDARAVEIAMRLGPGPVELQRDV